GVGSQLGHLERQKNTRRINRVEKPVCISDQYEPIAGALFRSIGIIHDRIDFIDALGSGDTLAARFAFLYFLVEYLSQVLAAVFHQIIGIGDDADARDVILERDIPEPAPAARRSAEHKRGAAVQIRLAVRSFEVRVQHGLFELGVANPPSKLVREHRALTSSVDDDLRMELLNRAVLHLHFDAARPVAIEQHLFDWSPLINGYPLFRGVFDQHLVEHRSSHLPGDRALVMVRFEEVEGTRFTSRRVCELNAVFNYKLALFQLLKKPHSLEGPIGICHQRFADVVTRELLLFEQDYFAAFAGEDAGDRAAGRTPTHDDHIENICVLVGCYFRHIELVSTLVQKTRIKSYRP